MATGFRGTFVIRWAQTALDGDEAPDIAFLRPGAAWSWHGAARRIDGPDSILPLAPSEDHRRLHERAAQSLARVLPDMWHVPPAAAETPTGEDSRQPGFTVTDGHCAWPLWLIGGAPGHPTLIAGPEGLPPPDREVWVVRVQLPARLPRRPAAAVICFTPGTLISTPGGALPVEALRPGDAVLTRDNGPQRLRWIGRRHVTGSRLAAEPGLAPIFLAPGALGPDVPLPGLTLSPDHRILLTGPAADALFGTPEVLVAARDLVDDDRVRVLRAAPSVTYLHLMLDRHEILWANGVASDSFHPGDADPLALSGAGLQAPVTSGAPFGPHVRRVLTTAEAAILLQSRPRAA
jgi:hypothetical protein